MDCLNEEALPLTEISWGDMNDGSDIQEKIETIYEEIVKWKKNIYKLPRGKAGRDFISELTRLINLFNYKTAWKDYALSL